MATLLLQMYTRTCIDKHGHLQTAFSAALYWKGGVSQEMDPDIAVPCCLLVLLVCGFVMAWMMFYKDPLDNDLGSSGRTPA